MSAHGTGRKAVDTRGVKGLPELKHDRIDVYRNIVVGEK